MDTSVKSLKKTFFRYAIPSLISQWVYSLYTLVDSLFVARGVSAQAFTAVNLSFPFLTLLFALSLTCAIGTSAVIGIRLGEKRENAANQAFTQNIAVNVFFSILIPVLVLPNIAWLAKLLGAHNAETLDYMKRYLTWIVPFSFAFMLTYNFDIMCKADRFPKLAATLTVVGTVLNIFLDWLFVIVMKKGVEGAAFATSLTQTIEICIYMKHFLSRKGTLRFTKFRFDFSLFTRSFANGISSGLTELSSGLTIFIFNRCILSLLGPDALLSYGIISYVNTLIIMSATGISQGVQPLLSYHFGRRDHNVLQRLLWYTVGFATFFCVISYIICYVLASDIATAYLGAADAALIQETARVMRIFTLSFLPLGISISVAGFFAATEHAFNSLIISFGRGFLLLVAALFATTKLMGGEGIWWATLVSELACALISSVLLVSVLKSLSASHGFSTWPMRKLVHEGLLFGIFETPKKQVV